MAARSCSLPARVQPPRRFCFSIPYSAVKTLLTHPLVHGIALLAVALAAGILIARVDPKTRPASVAPRCSARKSNNQRAASFGTNGSQALREPGALPAAASSTWPRPQADRALPQSPASPSRQPAPQPGEAARMAASETPRVATGFSEPSAAARAAASRFPASARAALSQEQLVDASPGYATLPQSGAVASSPFPATIQDGRAATARAMAQLDVSQCSPPEQSAIRASQETFAAAIAAAPDQDPASPAYADYWNDALNRQQEQLRITLGWDRYNRLSALAAQSSQSELTIP